MGSPTSLATLGSVRLYHSSHLESLPMGLPNRRIRAVSRISLGGFGWRRQWLLDSPGLVCQCVVTTNLIDEKGVSTSLESAYQASSASKDEDADLVLKPSPKPVLKGQPNGLVAPVDSIPSSSGRIFSGSRSEIPVEDREKVIQSLGEVLEKAEKLETARPVKLGGKEIRNNGKPNGNSKSSRPVSTNNGMRRSKTVKSVWRKGNPVANVQKVVMDLPRVKKEKEKEQKAQMKKAESSANVLRPPKTVPKLHAKPAVAPPPKTSVKKPLLASERKPILIDKFASKKPVVDAVAVEAVLAATKPAKGPPSSKLSKLKDERWKKSNMSGGPRRRLVEEDDIIEEDDSELGVAIPGVRKGRKWTKASRKAARLQAAKAAAKAAAPVKLEILEVGKGGMMADELAYNLALSEAEILSYLYSKGIKPDAVHTLDKDMVKMICKEYGVEVIEEDPVNSQMAKKKDMLETEDLDMLEVRPPIITIMGHVDHGKTTLLDYIRQSKVVASEAGGITQGIGAYKVQVPVDGKPQSCVFLDTPGHEAFGSMRARGAQVTDIAIIVVAADDGVRPQTIEAIAHAKAAGIDKEGASPDRVMQELSQAGLMPEEWGGDIPMVKISALKGENVDELLETVMLVAELQELKANPQRKAKGTCIEAGLEKSRGPVSTLIVQNGTLRRADIVVCGEAFGKVRALFDDRGGRVDQAGPSMAVQVIGLSDVPIAGDEFEVIDSLDVARERAEACAESLRASRISAKAGETKLTLSSLASAISSGKKSGLDMHQLNIIMKVDVQGSIEAIRQAIQVLPQDNITLKFILQAPGDVNTSDVDLAVAAEAIIFGFNVKAPGSVKSYVDKKNIEIRLYRVIYDLIDDMRNAMEGLLEPVEEQISIGVAKVRATFSSGSGRVAGCMVNEGKVVKGCGVHVVRNGKTIHTGKIDSLRRVKEEVKEVSAGLECGVGVDSFMDWVAGDTIEAFETVKKKRTLEEASASVAAALAGGLCPSIRQGSPSDSGTPLCGGPGMKMGKLGSALLRATLGRLSVRGSIWFALGSIATLVIDEFLGSTNKLKDSSSFFPCNGTEERPWLEALERGCNRRILLGTPLFGVAFLELVNE
ncbi:Translation initiation factor IF-2, chloroplastic [Apostasia shenzhenica]|uniref:Translation initiation factor IF-2, chloroplastic n=1 Tax=Apostasia shenzhenica TaxID=1088818 RepID=A0A2I0ADE3_9ASPA|nr:Translation initiation factor IF-2, chloroplastic [Apostasia shenzhenica]